MHLYDKLPYSNFTYKTQKAADSLDIVLYVGGTVYKLATVPNLFRTMYFS
jgi:hypothetical protein